MTPYTHRSTILLPLALVNAGTAQKFGQAFDPDTGGEQNFDTVRAGAAADTATHAVCDCWITADMAATMQALQAAAPAQLAAWCAQQYATRFPDDTAPSTDECTAFLAGLVMTVAARPEQLGGDPTLADVLAPLGFVIVPPPAMT